MEKLRQAKIRINATEREILNVIMTELTLNCA